MVVIFFGVIFLLQCSFPTEPVYDNPRDPDGVNYRIPYETSLSDPGNSVLSDEIFTVSWEVVRGASSYTIEEATNNLFDEAISQDVNGTSTDFSHSVNATTTYYYRVKANKSGESSGWSNSVDIIVINVMTEGHISIDIPWPEKEELK